MKSAYRATLPANPVNLLHKIAIHATKTHNTSTLLLESTFVQIVFRLVSYAYRRKIVRRVSVDFISTLTLRNAFSVPQHARLASTELTPAV
jgi:hypothetical protein